MPDGQVGILIGIFALVGLVVRPLMSPFIQPGKARAWIAWSTALTILSLLAYNLAHDFETLMAARLVHGTAYTFLGVAVTARTMAFIPSQRSGEAFGMLSIITLLPYAALPPLITPLSRMLGGFLPVLSLMALLMLLIYPLIFFGMGTSPSEAKTAASALKIREVLGNLKDSHIFVLLLSSLLLYTAFAPVFYNIKHYALNLGIAHAGLFFTLTILTEIAVRFFGGAYFDKMNKLRLLGFFPSGTGTGLSAPQSGPG